MRKKYTKYGGRLGVEHSNIHLDPEMSEEVK